MDNKEIVAVNNNMKIVCVQFAGSKVIYTYKTKENVAVGEVLKVGQTQIQITKIMDKDANFVNTKTGELTMEDNNIHAIRIKELVLYNQDSDVQYFQRFV